MKLRIVVLTIIFTLTSTGVCGSSQFNIWKAMKYKVIGAYKKVGLHVDPTVLKALRYLP